MTYTEKLEQDNLKLRMQLTEASNWIESQFNPESLFPDFFETECTPKEIVQKCEEVVSSTNNLIIPNQLEMFEETAEKVSLHEYDVHQSIYNLGKRLLSNASCIKSITQASLLHNIKACGVITNELINEIETKRLSRNEDGKGNTIEIPAKE